MSKDIICAILRQNLRKDERTIFRYSLQVVYKEPLTIEVQSMSNHNGKDQNPESDILDRTLSISENVHPDYEIVDPRSIYGGQTYAQWASCWLNWFLSTNPDRRNSGPVVFLRSHTFPNTVTGAYNSNTQNQSSSTVAGGLPEVYSGDMNYPNRYFNEPNIRICGDRLQIFEDQRVFIPIITAYTLKIEPYRDYGNLQDSTGMLIDNGDNPPEDAQLTINTRNIDLSQGMNGKKLEVDMFDFRITTPIFTAVVPDAPYVHL